MPSIHRPVLEARWFRPDKKYCDIDWNNFGEVVREFELRIKEWYIDPATELSRHGHFGFSVVAMSCLLIDALSQYVFGAQPSPSETASGVNNDTPESSRHRFVDFVDVWMPALSLGAEFSIRTGRVRGGIDEKLTTLPQVLYSGFRCGVLHAAHISLFGAIAGGAEVAQLEPSGVTKYDDGSDCPTVVVDPGLLLCHVKGAFARYLRELRDPSAGFDELRERFKEKFEDSFGVVISTVVR